MGFALSLVCTLPAYYLVVEQVVGGRALLIGILTFALLQMTIQLLFFLHLGSEPKPRWNSLFFGMTFSIILAIVAGSIIIISNLEYNMAPNDQSKRLVDNEGIYQVSGQKTGACEGQHTNHRVKIGNNQMEPKQTTASKCDTLTFINEGKEAREIMFGQHDEPLVYAGLTEVVVRKGRAKTITLSETGTYEFHDTTNHQISGEFIVQP
jgi:cytochrome o ubiquinol oxidase operon protein cyoD